MRDDWQKQALIGAAAGAVAGTIWYALTQGGSAVARNARPTPSTAPPKGFWVPRGNQGPSTPETIAALNCGTSVQGYGDAAMCPADRTMGFPTNIAERNSHILSKVKAGDYYVNWLPVVVESADHTITIWVSADALKIDGIRVEVSAYLQQQLADVMGASLMTPRISDLAFLEATKTGVVIPPITRSAAPTNWVNVPPDGSSMSTTPNMSTQSLDIDKLIIAKAGSLDAAKDKIVSTPGKIWGLANSLPGKISQGAQAALNYGWQLWTPAIPHQNYDPVTPAKNASGTPMRVYQGPGTAHSFSHLDYSQSAQFVLNDVLVDGQQTKLQTVFTDPALAPMVSHEGVLNVFRQPGVPMVGA